MNNNFEAYIKNSIENYKDSIIKEAMFYTIEGGKRFRQEITFAILKGFNIDESLAYPSGCALEFIQTYSLIHDDMPCMDNDTYRRGKLSCHAKYNEDIALLVGDSFLTHAFSIIANAKEYDDSLKINLINILSKYAGLDGMIYGQLLDITLNDIKDKDSLNEIDDNKTGGLFKFASLSAMYIAKNDNYKYFEDLGNLIGRVFQYQDDLFDVTKNIEETGKTNSDVNKKTALYVAKTKETLKEWIDDLFKQLDNMLTNAPFDNKYLKDIINKIKER